MPNIIRKINAQTRKEVAAMSLSQRASAIRAAERFIREHIGDRACNADVHRAEMLINLLEEGE